MKKYHTVTFLPENKIIQVEDRKTIFETIELDNPYGIELNFSRCCGAEGICQKCKIRTFQRMGQLTPIERGCLSEEELARGIRLSCQARVIQDTQVEIIYKQLFTIRVLDEHPAFDIDLRLRVKKVYVAAQDGELTFEQFQQIINERAGREDAPVKFSDAALAAGRDIVMPGSTAVLIDGEVVAVEEGDTSQALYAAAVDLGINTLTISLIDLASGKSIATVSNTNPQHEMGADLDSRISLSLADPLNLEMLNEEMLLRIDVLLHELCLSKGISPRHIYEITISGTTGMLHLFLKGVPGLLEQQVQFDNCRRVAFSARHASIKSSPHARIYTLPNISSFVGADITAGIIATQLHRSGDNVLFLDLGTTGKAVLCHQGAILAASTDEGAAFEAVGIKFGMRPEAGAIEQVRVNGDVQVEVIGESLPRGICGSGLIELTGALLKLGIIDDSGTFAEGKSNISPEISKRLIRSGRQKNFLLYRHEGEYASEIYVTQNDIYSLRRSRAYLLTVIQMLLQKTAMSFSDISRVLIGGAFGYHINPAAFIDIGLIPQVLHGKVQFVGNTSRAGAHLALLDRSILEEAEQIAQAVTCFDPADDPQFESLVNGALNFRAIL